jgi:acyl-coenzyme A synthetase/AMP-(fatty) acid ligase
MSLLQHRVLNGWPFFWLVAYKVPRAVQFVDDLPKTSAGKVMRRELKTLDQYTR